MDAVTHVCEVCGRTEDLTDQQAFDAGWDYPPRIGPWNESRNWGVR